MGISRLRWFDFLFKNLSVSIVAMSLLKGRAESGETETK